jgi:hypothetical protein
MLLAAARPMNETVSRAQWIYWDVGFLAWDASMAARRPAADGRSAWTRRKGLTR